MDGAGDARGVDFTAWGNSVNGDRGTRGDADGVGFYSVAFGCSGSKFYHDYDNDGVGAESTGYSIACTVPPYYSAKKGDCNDNDEKISPASPEICDAKDNNCDGQIDEGLAVTSYCTDADGDGHGVLGKATVMGCGVSKGFGVCDDDCNDTDPNMHAGAIEICNNKDDNCNNRVDENARVVCGRGWCANYGEGCTSNCTPGQPRTEECNDFDDDRDGVNDNGTDLELCGIPGLRCVAGGCLEQCRRGWRFRRHGAERRHRQHGQSRRHQQRRLAVGRWDFQLERQSRTHAWLRSLRRIARPPGLGC